MPNFKVTNTVSKMFLVTDAKGFEGLIAAHTHLMNVFDASLMAILIRSAVESGEGWEDTRRGMRIDKTDLPVNLKPMPA